RAMNMAPFIFWNLAFYTIIRTQLLQAVVEEIPVKRFIFNGTFKANADNEKLFSTILEKRIPLIGG
ncbi:hypothetical protein ABNC33_21140, partial [Paenibacillus larvae]